MTKSWIPTDFNITKAKAYPDLLNRYLVVKMVKACRIQRSQTLRGKPSMPVPQATGYRSMELEASAAPCKVARTSADDRTPLARARYSFSEKIRWQDPMGGQDKPTDRETADALAIGGLRNAAGSVSRLHFLASLGQKMGQAMRGALMDNLNKHRRQSDLNEQDAWINQVRACIGSEDRKPPVAAIAKIKAIIHEFTRQPGAAQRAAAPSLSDLDTVTLEDWRVASKHPDVEVCGWQRTGVPGGIKLMPTDAGGIFPPATDAASADVSQLRRRGGT